MSKAPRITPLRHAILCVIRDHELPMTVAQIYASEPEGCAPFASPDNIKQAITPLLECEPPLIRREYSTFDRLSYVYTISDEGLKAIEALGDPGIDTGHTDEAEEGEEDEEAIDFALWASGVLQIQIGDDNFAVPAKHVPLLHTYLDEHEIGVRITLSRGEFEVLEHAQKELAKIKQWVVDGILIIEENGALTINPAANEAIAAALHAPPVPPAAPAAPKPDAIAAADAEYHARELAEINSLRSADHGRTMPHHAPRINFGEPPPGTEATGLPGVELDGPNGIGGELSHGMTREQQFAETCGRG